ncbi:MAG TPA: lytic murein transglycosylase, partial [Aliiroseovarius sp.]|nr:lytic murein transglycosylase [Aliiroseovarius sp.]
LGSWAGAMGHGQFMPSSVLAYAVDHDGDGRADIWHKDPEDGLASIANYLAKHGWRRGQNCVIRVTVPDVFDHSLTGLDQSAPANTWQERGITMPDGTPPVDYGKASLIQPAGHKGPALLAFNNFRTLLRYNNAVFYALAVSTLASQISGSKALRIDWPNDRPLTRTEIKALQSGLSGAGYDAGSPDGLMGPDTLRAIRAYQIARNLPADGFPSKDLLVHLARNTLGSARG